MPTGVTMLEQMLQRKRVPGQTKEALQQQAAAKSGKGIMVLYGSQTGTAAEIAKSLASEAKGKGMEAQCMTMNEFGFENLNAENTPVVVMVASSTGDGDAPDNCGKFFSRAKKSSNAPDLLDGIMFTVLGLGDSNYTRFMRIPRVLKRRFEEMGAKLFYKHGEADEVDGLEEMVEKWVDDIWGPLRSAANGEAESVSKARPTIPATATGAAADAGAAGAAPTLQGLPAMPQCPVAVMWESDDVKAAQIREKEVSGPSEEEVARRDPKGLYSPEEPFWGTVQLTKYLTTPQSDKTVLHVDINIAGSNMDFQPGDAIGVLPENNPDVVEDILKRLGEDGGRVFSIASRQPGVGGPHRLLSHLGWPCSLRKALSSGCDITSVPKKSLLRVLGEYCGDTAEKNAMLRLCTRDGKDEYDEQIKNGQPGLLDLLTKFPSCKPPVAELLSALPALMPRLYSITNCSDITGEEVHVALSIVKFGTVEGRTREGVASNWMNRTLSPAIVAKAVAKPRIAVYLRPSVAMRPPALEKHVIMVGPGTGVAPFRGFLQRRKAQIKAAGGADGAGDSWLFFGCRHPEQDYIYKHDLEQLEREKTLGHLQLAFSRESAKKVYVQDRLKENAAEVYRLLCDAGGYLFICGDGAKMAKDVHAAVRGILEQHGGMSEKKAEDAMVAMAREGRYVRDVWS